MMNQRRRFEVLVPRHFGNGEEVPSALIVQTLRDLEFDLGGVHVETQMVRGLSRISGDIEDRFVRLFCDVKDTAENLAFFYKLKKSLRERFQADEIPMATFLVGVL